MEQFHHPVSKWAQIQQLLTNNQTIKEQMNDLNETIDVLQARLPHRAGVHIPGVSRTEGPSLSSHPGASTAANNYARH